MDKYELLFKDLEDIKLKGLTKAVIEKLKKLNIFSIYDLLYYFPRAYENSAVLKNVFTAKEGESVILKGKILNISKKFFKGNKIMTTASFLDETGIIELIWFNNRYVHTSIKIGDNLLVTGKIKKGAKFQIINPSYKKTFKLDDIKKEANLEPIYSLTKGLNQVKLRTLIKNAIDTYGYLLFENIPIDFVYDNKIMSRQNSIINIHFPENEKALNLSIRRFTYEEIMVLEMAILKKRFIDDGKNQNLYKLSDNKTLVKEYVKNLEFELTNSQKKVITSIYKELNEGKYINRLIQGDVGSGKTIVALIIMMYMAENNYQSVLMAPTEILAQQHYKKLAKDLEKYDINVALLSSSVKSKKKQELLEKIKNGQIDIVIGTHSLIEEDVVFKNLALSVIDEQHRFGVEQRNTLRKKSYIPNIIAMSATPIPRSLALTIYGDLDVSTITELPKGRKVIKTKWIKNVSEEKQMYKFIKQKLLEGQQIYIVAPLIENSDKINAKSAKEVFEEITKEFKDFQIGLLHGKLKNKEKDSIMEDFRDKKINILVSTTVIEVGVDISNANIMIVKNAERFGLSSLHQLRGRVGRGKDSGYCFLQSDTDNEISKKRLSIMEENIDGFKIAEEDLKLRNTGEIFGLRQSGISDLVLLDIVKNIKEIEAVKTFVQQYLKEHKGLIENTYLKRDIEKKHN